MRPILRRFENNGKKALVVSGSAKKEVLRDLKEIFASAREHGESEEQVIGRLGSPEEFADNINEQMGVSRTERLRLRRRRQITVVSIFAVLALAAGLLSRFSSVPNDAIGYSDSMTSIKIESARLDVPMLLVVIGIAAMAVAVIMTIRYRRGAK